MSHYALAVFSTKPNLEAFDELLIPYDENNENFYVFEPVDQSVIGEKWKKFHKQNPKWTAEHYLNAMWHYDKASGSFGYWSNPNAMYDYYTIGGKDYIFETLDHAETDTFRKKSEIDWFRLDLDEPLADRLAHLCKEWEKRSVEGDGLFAPEYYIERYGDCDTYVEEMLRPVTPYAFITPDGKLHAPGRVGWFGMSSETAETERAYFKEWCDFIKNAPDCYVTICDCHI